MTLFFLRILAFLLQHLPLSAAKGITCFAGEFIFLFARKRRRLLLSNLSHAFPERDHHWLAATGRASIYQMVEFALLAVFLPRCSEKRLREIFTMAEESRNLILERTASGRPHILLAPHLGPQEGLCLIPFLMPEMPPIGAIYRPVKNEAVDRWIRESRERFGIRLFSRKQGLQSAIRLLKQKHWFGLLFDQNSSAQGTLITFFDRVASATDLPGIVAERFDADVLFLHIKRHAFWRMELRVVPGPPTGDRDEITFAINHWLQELLRNDETLIPGWLWAHNRWRHQRIPQFFLRTKKNLIEKQAVFLGRPSLPRTERFLIRLPDRLGEVVDFLPILRAIRTSRPDVAITVIGKESWLPVVTGCNLCEDAIALPTPGTGYFPFFIRLRRRFPQVYLLTVDSLQHDLEAWLTGAPHRYGIQSPNGRRRRLLTRTWSRPIQLENVPRIQLWEAFLHAFGFEKPLDFSPISYPVPRSPTRAATIGILPRANTSTNPEVSARWRQIIEQILQSHPDTSVRILDSADRPIAARKILCNLPEDRIELPNCHQGSLPELIDCLAGCELVVGDDSDRIHLANAMGIPTVGFFEPPAAIPEPPVFDAPTAILQNLLGESPQPITVDQILKATADLLRTKKR